MESLDLFERDLVHATLRIPLALLEGDGQQAPRFIWCGDDLAFVSS
jgi:hypothetical protein